MVVLLCGEMAPGVRKPLPLFSPSPHQQKDPVVTRPAREDSLKAQGPGTRHQSPKRCLFVDCRPAHRRTDCRKDGLAWLKKKAAGEMLHRGGFQRLERHQVGPEPGAGEDVPGGTLQEDRLRRQSAGDCCAELEPVLVRPVVQELEMNWKF